MYNNIKLNQYYYIKFSEIGGMRHEYKQFIKCNVLWDAAMYRSFKINIRGTVENNLCNGEK